MTTIPTTVPSDPYANKSLGSALTFLVFTLLQALSTEGFEFDQEGVTSLAGVVATFVVYVVSNRKRLLS